MAKQCSGVFIVGTDTEVGKTYQAVSLARLLAARGLRLGVYKPAASGIVAGEPGDPELLRAAAGLDCPIEHVCPQRFTAACAPPVAARLEARQVDAELLIRGAELWFERCDFLIVEGVGGVLAPISDTMLVLDLAVQLGFPTILVAANRLGVVNHTLLALEAMAARSLENLGIVLNTLPPPEPLSEQSHPQAALRGDVDISTETNALLLAQFAPGVPIVSTISELRIPSLQLKSGQV